MDFGTLRTDSVIKNVEKVLGKQEYMKEIFTYEIIEKKESTLLTFSTSESALQRIKEEELGKTALFTDRDELTDYQIINAYRSAWNVESAFKQMKDTDFLTVRPLFHWTDSKIRVHLFICVLSSFQNCIVHISTKLGLEYGPVVSPIIQNKDFFSKWSDTLPFYRNVRTEGVSIHAASLKLEAKRRFRKLHSQHDLLRWAELS